MWVGKVLRSVFEVSCRVFEVLRSVGKQKMWVERVLRSVFEVSCRVFGVYSTIGDSILLTLIKSEVLLHSYLFIKPDLYQFCG